MVLRKLVMAAAGTAFFAAGFGSVQPVAAQVSEAQVSIKYGLGLSPVALNLRGKNKKKVALGSYLVNAVGACNECHTNPPFATGGDPFLGDPLKINATAYLGGGTCFGPVQSRDITPDSNGRPAGLTLSEFKNVMRSGLDPTNGEILQVMPWPEYQHMQDSDLSAIYAYLTAIPPVPTPTNTCP